MRGVGGKGVGMGGHGIIGASWFEQKAALQPIVRIGQLHYVLLDWALEIIVWRLMDRDGQVLLYVPPWFSQCRTGYSFR